MHKLLDLIPLGTVAVIGMLVLSVSPLYGSWGNKTKQKTVWREV
jgi:hypothetical protein